MIPKRVKLSGFLCYKDEQEVAFDGSTLWMLAGLNGSGKSTIFDAVTYALFGHHRGGAQAAAELINKDSKALSVEFDFTVEKQLYRIIRTLRRDTKGGARGTHNVLRYDASMGDGKWVAEPDTSLNEGFKNWIREKIGLNYDTFTSSVLLLQGRAEKLLDSKPSGRAEVLAGIVDLERYQALHEKIDGERRDTKAKLENLESQLTAIPNVTDIELQAAENRLLDAEDARTAANKEIDRLQQLAYQSKAWTTLQVRLAEMRGRWDRAKNLIAEASTIEKAYQRYRALKEVIPQVLVIQEKQRKLIESEQSSAQCTKLLDHSRSDENAHLTNIESKKLHREKLHKNLLAEEKHLEGLTAKLRELSGQLSQVKLYEVQQVTLNRLKSDLSRLPTDLAAAVVKAEAEYERTQELGRVLPTLERLANTRTQLLAAIQQAHDATEREAKTRERGDMARKRQADTKQQLDQALLALKQADERATEAKTLSLQAKQAVEEFTKLEGAKVCRSCGLPLTPQHFQEEKGKREKDLKAKVVVHKSSVEAQQAAIVVETAARDQYEAADRELQKLREDYREIKSKREQAIADHERLESDCRQQYSALAEEYRRRVAPTMPDDWSTTTWPTANDLTALRRTAGDRESTRSALNAAREQLAQFERLDAELKSTQKTLDQVRATLPPGEPSKLREQETQLKADEEATVVKVRSAKRQILEIDQAIEHANRELVGVRQTISDISAKIGAEEATRTQYHDAIDRAAKLLPEDWREVALKAGLAEQNRWKGELEELQRKKTEERFQELATMRAGIEAMREEIALIETEAQGYPTEAQCAPDAVQHRITAAKQEQVQADTALQKAREEKAILDGYNKQRQQMAVEKLTLDKELAITGNLAKLLGRDRLQRYLVRTAEANIVEYANAILDRLSGGQLYLRLCGSGTDDKTDRALELEAYNRQTGGNAINVAFLSGSQRFRVAVSLALGIGQYASKQHRPIESVIIDEGFGCLDRNGRQVMIQELQNLRGHLQCILLVSHQEEFAEAFPDGYRFELNNGATKISRFQR